MKRYMIPLMAASLALSACGKLPDEESSETPKQACVYEKVNINDLISSTGSYEDKWIETEGKVEHIRTQVGIYTFSLSLGGDSGFVVGKSVWYERTRDNQKALHTLDVRLESMKQRGTTIGIRGKVNKGDVDIYQIYDSNKLYLSAKRKDCFH